MDMALTTTRNLLTAFWTAPVAAAEHAINERLRARPTRNSCDVAFFEMAGDVQLHVNVTHRRRTVTGRGWTGPGNTRAGFVHNRVFARGAAGRMAADVCRMVAAEAV
jgi:hypothetical protein